MTNSLKETSILEYLKTIDFKGEWSYEAIETDIARFIGERPSLDVTYKKDVMLMEGSAKAKEVRKLEKVAVIYTDLDNKIKKIEILID